MANMEIVFYFFSAIKCFLTYNLINLFNNFKHFTSHPRCTCIKHILQEMVPSEGALLILVVVRNGDNVSENYFA
jgi:hypothetical protein